MRRRKYSRVVRPIFATDPLEGRVVEPVEGWAVHHTRNGLDDDPLVREWFKIGELLQQEWAEQA